LDFFKEAAFSEDVFGNTLDGSLENGSGGLTNSGEITLLYSTSTEDVVVSEILGCKITNR
jgi:hypothetical protein